MTGEITLAHLLAFNLILLAAWLSPGPAMLYALRNTLKGGLATGLTTGMGLAMVASGWTLAAFLGLSAVFALVPWAYGALKVAGALYLLWIAVHIWRDARNPMPADSGHLMARAALWRAFGGGMLVNLANPKAVLFAGAVLAVVFPAGLGANETALVLTNQFLLEVVGYATLAFVLSRPAARAAWVRVRLWIDRGCHGRAWATAAGAAARRRVFCSRPHRGNAMTERDHG